MRVLSGYWANALRPMANKVQAMDG
jgi:hypothetical protein